MRVRLIPNQQTVYKWAFSHPHSLIRSLPWPSFLIRSFSEEMRLNLTDDKTNTQMSLIETRWSRPTKLHFLESADAISSSSATLLLPAVCCRSILVARSSFLSCCCGDGSAVAPIVSQSLHLEQQYGREIATMLPLIPNNDWEMTTNFFQTSKVVVICSWS